LRTGAEVKGTQYTYRSAQTGSNTARIAITVRRFSSQPVPRLMMNTDAGRITSDERTRSTLTGFPHAWQHAVPPGPSISFRLAERQREFPQ